jgi:hypothetical protein
MRVIQRRRCPRLPLKSIESLAIPGKFFGQKLERNKTPQLGVLRPVNDTHPPAAQPLDDPIMRNGFTDQRKNRALCATILGANQQQVNKRRGGTLREKFGYTPSGGSIFLLRL